LPSLAVRNGKVSNGAQFEIVHRSSAVNPVKSLKSTVEKQIEGMLGILSLLFSLFSANILNLSCVFEIANGS
jgi:hypothetical protein